MTSPLAFQVAFRVQIIHGFHGIVEREGGIFAFGQIPGKTVEKKGAKGAKIRDFDCHPLNPSVSIHARRNEPGSTIQMILHHAG